MPIPFSEEEETLAAAVTPWSVSSTHTNLDQNITSSTALTTSGGTVGYYNEFLQDDHNLTLPSAGTITHFVSPQQPVFTFTAPTRVSMIIPTTTNITPIRAAGWVYSPMGYHTVIGSFIGYDANFSRVS